MLPSGLAASVGVVVREVGPCDGLPFDASMVPRRRVAQWLDGKPLHGATRRAGLPKTLALA